MSDSHEYAFYEGLENHMREEKLVTLDSDRYEELINVSRLVLLED